VRSVTTRSPPLVLIICEIVFVYWSAMDALAHSITLQRIFIPIKGAIVAFTPPTPRPIRTIADASPPIPAPCWRAIGREVANKIMQPHAYNLSICQVTIPICITQWAYDMLIHSVLYRPSQLSEITAKARGVM